MIYISWDIECDRLKWVIMNHFLPFIPPSTKNPQKIRILKKWKKMLEIWQFYTCVPKTTTTWGTVPEIHSETHIIFRHFEPFLPFYPSNNPENQNFEKMKNVSGDIIILQMCDKNNSHMMYAFQDKECDRQFFLSFWAIFY